MPIHIRPLQAEDIPQVVAIENETIPFPWGEQAFYGCLKAGFLGWVLEFDKQIAGYAVVMQVLNESELLSMAIAPAYQGQQLGYGLLSYVLAQLHLQGVKVMFLEVRKSNAVAIHLYQKLGFTEIGLRKNYYETATGHEDAILYSIHMI